MVMPWSTGRLGGTALVIFLNAYGIRYTYMPAYLATVLQRIGTLKSVCSSWFALISRDKYEHTHLRVPIIFLCKQKILRRLLNVIGKK